MQKSTEQPANNVTHNPFAQTFFHGTKAELKIGDFIQPGFQCNFADRKLRYVYVSATLTAAIWGAELALGSGQQRIYLVEATGEVEDDPNVTDKKFPGNPTMSYRSVYPFKIIGEVATWNGHSAEQIQAMKEGIKKLAEQGVDMIID
ncbi:NAD(+)--rifampin ADP-ribosyltransferase [Mucilaginibacter hurinus]|uniref:NAD(+)--rifampin ADP-ribosyltransferase n=1 Tax=Mucilaginibacter hurinus TaxID=2201324 RepID=A0A367GRI8_9SPHI|nr:NAD(+)--rifampin ADP-ribosyltransferase [Mucilaginibacter hurinus]RCH55456.1 NAD(+)--rifampin ADP-ribosyltransferase [Mucilaginibacter hurinus]